MSKRALWTLGTFIAGVAFKLFEPVPVRTYGWEPLPGESRRRRVRRTDR